MQIPVCTWGKTKSPGGLFRAFGRSTDVFVNGAQRFLPRFLLFFTTFLAFGFLEAALAFFFG